MKRSSLLWGTWCRFGFSEVLFLRTRLWQPWWVSRKVAERTTGNGDVCGGTGLRNNITVFGGRFRRNPLLPNVFPVRHSATMGCLYQPPFASQKGEGYVRLNNPWEGTRELTSCTVSHASPLPWGHLPWGSQAWCPPGADGESSPLLPTFELCSACRAFGVRWLYPHLFFLDPSTSLSPLFIAFHSFVLCHLCIFTITPSHIHISIAPQLCPAF
nr:uncharacterized protein LOC110358167 [Columba livia]